MEAGIKKRQKMTDFYPKDRFLVQMPWSLFWIKIINNLKVYSSNMSLIKNILKILYTNTHVCTE